MKCQNCGEEFEGKESDEVCPQCYEHMMEQWAKEAAAQEYANQQWREYWEQQQRDDEERAEQRRKERQEEG